MDFPESLRLGFVFLASKRRVLEIQKLHALALEKQHRGVVFLDSQKLPALVPFFWRLGFEFLDFQKLLAPTLEKGAKAGSF